MHLNCKIILNVSRKIACFVIGVYICALPVLIAVAQDGDASERTKEEIRLLQDEDVRLLSHTEKILKAEKDFVFDYGGWLTWAYHYYRDMDNDRNEEDWLNEIYTLDARIWGKATYKNTLSLYVRMKNYYVWKPKVSSEYTGIGDDYEGPKVDMLYVDLDLYKVSKIIKAEYDIEIDQKRSLEEEGSNEENTEESGQERPFFIPLSIRAGRQFFSLGRGITYSNVHDGIGFNYYLWKWLRLKLFASKSKRHENNIDYSVPGYDKENDRNFYGAELGWEIGKLSLYGYTLIQKDNSEESPQDSSQDYTYDSQYLGLGINGKPTPRFSYWGEFIKEYGRSYTDASKTALRRDDVDAWAFDIGAKYKIDFYSHPTLEAEIAYGSGDKDRTRVTNTTGGNVNGDDTNFLYFGIFNAGYALAPRLSNLYIYKLGFSFKPFEKISFIKDNIAMGLKFFIYRKDEKDGGIYDIDATESKSDVGREFDFFLHWRLQPDMYLTARYGIFFPGSAYAQETRDSAEYAYIRLRYTF